MIDILSLLGAINLLIFSVTLYSVKCKRPDTKYLFSFITFSMSLSLVDAYIVHSGHYLDCPYLINISLVTTALIGPHFRFYIASILGEKITFSKKHFAHLIPGLLFLIGYIAFQLQDNNFKIAYVEGNETAIVWLKNGVLSVLNFISLLYFISTFTQIIKHEKLWENNFSSTDKLNLNSMKRVILYIIISMIIALILSATGYQRHLLESITIVMMNILYIAIYVRTVQKPHFIYDYEYIDRSAWENQGDTAATDVHDAYKTDNELIFNKLEEYISTSKIYTTPKLSLDFVAQNLGIKKYLLSQAINSHSGQNFFTFINSYRIKEAKRILTGSEMANDTMDTIGLACGFNSTSSFFMVFKRFEGQTPMQYRKQHLIST